MQGSALVLARRPNAEHTTQHAQLWQNMRQVYHTSVLVSSVTAPPYLCLDNRLRSQQLHECGNRGQSSARVLGTRS